MFQTTNISRWRVEGLWGFPSMDPLPPGCGTLLGGSCLAERVRHFAAASASPPQLLDGHSFRAS